MYDNVVELRVGAAASCMIRVAYPATKPQKSIQVMWSWMRAVEYLYGQPSRWRHKGRVSDLILRKKFTAIGQSEWS